MKAVNLKCKAIEEEQVQEGRVGLLTMKQEFAKCKRISSTSWPELQLSTFVHRNMASSIVTFTFQKWEDIDVDWINIVLSRSIVANEIAQIVLDADYM